MRWLIVVIVSPLASRRSTRQRFISSRDQHEGRQRALSPEPRARYQHTGDGMFPLEWCLPPNGQPQNTTPTSDWLVGAD
jgi:hypothetical protein